MGRLVKRLGVPKSYHDVFIDSDFGFDTTALARLKRIIVDAYKEKQQHMIVMFYFRDKLKNGLSKLPAELFSDFNKYII